MAQLSGYPGQQFLVQKTLQVICHWYSQTAHTWMFFMWLSYWTVVIFCSKRKFHSLNLNSNLLSPLLMYVFYDSSCTKQAKHILFPQMIFKNQQCKAALTANNQNQESWGESKGNQQGSNPKSKIYCLCL